MTSTLFGGRAHCEIPAFSLPDHVRTGLGMPLGAMATFTGVRSGSSLTISLPAPERLRSSVPGASMPTVGDHLP